jgi:hypothetical protein
MRGSSEAMRKNAVIVLFLGLLLLARSGLAQEKFIDVRQTMANALTAAKDAAKKGDWDGAAASLEKARSTWTEEVRPLIRESVKVDKDYQEYFDRIGEVESNLDAAAAAIVARSLADLEAKVNAAIWAFSHHPRGFSVPKPRYSAWDWVFGLGIGLGFCIFAVWFGFYLRCSYYSRFPKARFIR